MPREVTGPPRPIFDRQGCHSGSHINGAAAVAFYSAKFRQGLAKASRGGPELYNPFGPSVNVSRVSLKLLRT